MQHPTNNGRLGQALTFRQFAQAHRRALAAFLIVFVVISLIIVVRAFGAMANVVEPENGSVGNGATKLTNDSSASGRGAVRFASVSGGTGGGATPPSTTGGTPPAGAAPGISKGMVEDDNGGSGQDAADMKTLGIKWNRGWLECGGGAGQASFAQTLQAAGVTYLPSFNCGITTPIADYKAKLAADMKALMPFGVHVWEIGNEMDGGWTAENNYCNNNATPGNMACAQKAYLPYLQAAYETVHATDPQGVVIYGGLSSYDVNIGPWLKEMTASQAWQWMDGMGYHPYGNSLQESMASMDTLKNAMAANASWASKPIWITEVGCWSSGLGSQQNSPCSPQNESGKAQYLKGLMDGLKAWNKGTSFEIRAPICWYILHESGSTPGYGLVQTGGSRTYFEAFTTYKNYVF